MPSVVSFYLSSIRDGSGRARRGFLLEFLAVPETDDKEDVSGNGFRHFGKTPHSVSGPLPTGSIQGALIIKQSMRNYGFYCQDLLALETFRLSAIW
ncbi:hypothetical protein J6590_035311 [Homalodisca vitripennis]|nr:hypothetical protein J6590_035311 [Homalodisca vitripennis]